MDVYPASDGIALFIRDISARKRAEQKLRQSEERYRRLLEATDDGILTVDDQGRYVDVNDSYCRILKATRGRLIGAHFSEFISPERLKEAEAAFAALRTGGTTPVDFPLRAPDGAIIELVWTSSSYFLPGLYFCCCRDITARKRSERAFETHQRDLQRLLSALPDVISRSGPDLLILYTSPAIERLTGLPPAHFSGKTHLETGWAPDVSARGDAARCRFPSWRWRSWLNRSPISPLGGAAPSLDPSSKTSRTKRATDIWRRRSSSNRRSGCRTN